MTDFTKLPIGTKIYYIGDFCNQPNFGEIVAATSNRWSPVQYDMRMLDGELIQGILPTNFGGLEHGGHRFRLQVLEDQQRYNRMKEGFGSAVEAEA